MRHPPLSGAPPIQRRAVDGLVVSSAPLAQLIMIIDIGRSHFQLPGGRERINQSIIVIAINLGPSLAGASDLLRRH